MSPSGTTHTMSHGRKKKKKEKRKKKIEKIGTRKMKEIEKTWTNPSK